MNIVIREGTVNLGPQLVHKLVRVLRQRVDSTEWVIVSAAVSEQLRE